MSVENNLNSLFQEGMNGAWKIVWILLFLFILAIGIEAIFNYRKGKR